eukprot:2141095-Rhodomonas_salina.2
MAENGRQAREEVQKVIRLVLGAPQTQISTRHAQISTSRAQISTGADLEVRFGTSGPTKAPRPLREIADLPEIRSSLPQSHRHAEPARSSPKPEQWGCCGMRRAQSGSFRSSPQ